MLLGAVLIDAFHAALEDAVIAFNRVRVCYPSQNRMPTVLTRMLDLLGYEVWYKFINNIFISFNSAG